MVFPKAVSVVPHVLLKEIDHADVPAEYLFLALEGDESYTIILRHQFANVLVKVIVEGFGWNYENYISPH